MNDSHLNQSLHVDSPYSSTEENKNYNHFETTSLMTGSPSEEVMINTLAPLENNSPSNNQPVESICQEDASGKSGTLRSPHHISPIRSHNQDIFQPNTLTSHAANLMSRTSIQNASSQPEILQTQPAISNSDKTNSDQPNQLTSELPKSLPPSSNHGTET